MKSSFIQEFKEFAFKGNMVDLAVGVVIGAAFGKIITAFVNDIIMPLVGYAIAFAHVPDDYQKWHVGKFMVGDLMAEIINFIIVAIVVFIVIVKLVGALMKSNAKLEEAPAPAAPPPPTNEEVLLAEIRDAIRAKPI